MPSAYQPFSHRKHLVTYRTPAGIQEIREQSSESELICASFHLLSISLSLSANEVYLFCSSSLSIIVFTSPILPTMTTLLLALVTAVYSRFLFKSLGGHLRSGITTTGYSLPCDLCMVIANACSSSSSWLYGYSVCLPSSNSTTILCS